WERWRRIAAQATEQSRGVSPPDISAPMKVKDLLAIGAETRIVLSATERQIRLTDADRPGARSVVLAFGPDGEWNDREMAMIRAAGWTSASLGTGILRAETAVIAAVAVTSSILAK